MVKLNLKNHLLFVSMLSLTIGCQMKASQKENEKPTSAEVTTEIKAQVDSLYQVYERFDFDWIEFYANDYTAIYPDSPVKQMKKDSLTAQWERIYDKYNVKLLDRGEPTIIESQDMAISYNSFNEIFINKETRDTIKNVGTYIIAWKRQPDDTWKIVFETLHNN